MSELRTRLGALRRRRGFLLIAALWATASVGLCFLPLANRPGFVHALATNVMVGVLGLGVGLVAGRLSGPARPLLAVATGTMALAALVGVSLLVALASGAVVGTCDLTRDLGWYPVLPLVSAPLAAALGVVVARVTRRWWAALLAGAGVLLVTGAATAWPLVFGPQAFAVNHLLGYVPGPLYDERAVVSGAVLAYRALTLCWAGVVLAAVSASASRSRAALVVLGVFAVGVAGLTAARERLGFHRSFDGIADALGGVVRTEHFVIHYPAERDAEWVRRTVLDHELRHRQIVRWLELDEGAGPPVESYVFRSSSEKASLTGAGRTSIAKPWLHAIFIEDRGHPHSVLKHELVHALAAELGSGPFAVASEGGLLTNAGLVEGLAVAADWRVDDLSVHEWAAAMRAVGVAPDARRLFSMTGFFRESSGRAYTLAGSFVRWLADTRGIDVVKRAYRTGSLAAAGDDPDALFEAWAAFLDATPLPPRAVRLAEHRFRQPSIFHRPCAFDVAEARRAGNAALAAGRHPDALAHFENCRRLEPQDPGHLERIFETHRAAGDAEAAARAAQALLAHPKTAAHLVARVHMTLGDDAWRAGDDAAAAEEYRTVLAGTSDAGTIRLATVKLVATGRPDLAPVLRPFLLGELQGPPAVVRLREQLEAEPDSALLAYLVGRQLYNARAWEHALEYLERARDLGLTEDGGLARENLRLVAHAHYELGDGAACADAWRAYAALPGDGEAPRLRAEDWIERCRLETALDGAPRGVPLEPGEPRGTGAPE